MGSIFIVAGTTIGAGMLAMPLAAVHTRRSSANNLSPYTYQESVMSFSQAVSGLNAAATNLDVIGNN
ncbi:flagellar basal body protein, partial [Salmonella enterica subsp. enterica serovar Montevideo]|nr:flagellar basal body protein [Salmonella enterica subsp. enterica serovar Montevideo]